MFIETERLTVRDFNPDDVNDLHEILGDAETMQNLEPAYDFEKTRKFLEGFCIAKKGAVAAVLKDSKKMIGYILFKPLEESVYEIGWAFNKKYWRQGYAYEACSELIAYGFRELDIRKVVAETIDGQKSVGLMEKLGMKCEGVQMSQTKDNSGNTADLYLYGIMQSEGNSMKIRCVWEHNGDDSIVYSDNYIGAFARGRTKDIALEKMADEVRSYLRWRNEPETDSFETEIVQEKISGLNISDADSDVLFETEKGALDLSEYEELKALALRSAEDFLTLYESIPDKNRSCLPNRQTFYGQVPRTAFEMYEHTKNVNGYYFGEIGVNVDNEGTILSCRIRGFELLEANPGFLNNKVFDGSYGEEWSLRKVLRRFIWHDRIHAKAMYRMAIKTFGADAVPNIFQFVV